MKSNQLKEPKRVAVCLEMEWGHKRHLETYAGVHKYAEEAGWECVTTPSAARVLNPRSAFAPFDGILGRITEPLARAASEIEIPAVNVWLNSPAENVTSVVADFETSGKMAAQHLIGRGFRRFGYMGFLREKDARYQVRGFRDTLNRLVFVSQATVSPERILEEGAGKFSKDWTMVRLGSLRSEFL